MIGLIQVYFAGGSVSDENTEDHVPCLWTRSNVADYVS